MIGLKEIYIYIYIMLKYIRINPCSLVAQYRANNDFQTFSHSQLCLVRNQAQYR